METPTCRSYGAPIRSQVSAHRHVASATDFVIRLWVKRMVKGGDRHRQSVAPSPGESSLSYRLSSLGQRVRP